MPESNTTLTYLSILRELEKEVAKLAGKEAPSAGAILTRTNALFAGTVGGLLSFATSKIADGKKGIAKKLGVKEQAIKKSEEVRLRHLSAWTQSHARYDIGRATPWPPLVPIGLSVEKFVGTVIGMHSESPGEPLEQVVCSSLKDTVAPALAWGLWCQLGTLPAECRSGAASAVVASIMRPSPPEGDPSKLELKGAQQTAVSVPYLRLVHGWVNILQQRKAKWCLPDPLILEFRQEIVSLLSLQQESPRKNSGEDEPCQSLTDILFRNYGAGDHGSERARVIAMVRRRSPEGSAFLRNRSLLEGANLPELANFRSLLQGNLKAAVEDAKESLDASGPTKERFGQMACGRAYWLARMTFGRHESKGVIEAEASTLTLRLLQAAAKSFGGDPEKRTYCLRFAAGYASNPRYFRSDYVLQKQGECIDDYARAINHRPKLVEMFRARLSWQRQASGKGLKNSHEARNAARHYNSALDGAISTEGGLDSEAHVHLFPELYVFLETFGDSGSAGGKKVLAVIDHVVQHNFGIYFDADVEKRLIKAGIDQYQIWREAQDEEISEVAERRGLAEAKGDRVLHEMLERRVRESNARRRAENDEENPPSTN